MLKRKVYWSYLLQNLILLKLRRLCLVFFVTVLLQLTVFSQNLSTGNPLIKNFLPAEYGASSQNWSVIQDHRGVMFFGNTQAILEFDGSRWSTYDLPNLVPARSLDVSPEGVLYVGTFGNFGYLSVNTDGSRAFVSLANKIKEDEHNEFADIWRVAAVSSGTYFFTPNRIYCFNNGEINVIEAEMEAMFGFKAYDRVFVMLKDKGLAIIEDNELIKLPHTSVFNSEHRMYTLIEFKDEKILIGTRNSGFYTYDLAFFKENERYNFKKKVAGSVIRHLKSNATEYINENSMYSATKVNDNLFAFGTVTGGIVLINQKGNIERIINSNHSLNNNCIYSLYADESGNLWAGLQQGISHIDLSYPLSFYNEEYNKLSGFVTSTVMFNNELYVGTMSGVYKYPTQTSTSGEKLEFTKLTEEIFEFWDFAAVRNNLLAVGNGGIYSLKRGKLINILEESASVIEKSKFSDDLLFIGHDEEFAVYHIKGKGKQIRLKKYFSFTGVDERIVSIVEFQPGELWLSTDFDGIYKVKYKPEDIEKYKIKHFTVDNGLPTNEYNSVQVIDNKIYITTRKGLYIPQENNDSIIFVQDNSIGKVFAADSASLIQVLPFKDKFIVNSENQKVGLLSKTESGNYTWDNQFSIRFPNIYKVAIFNNLLDIYTSNGLYLYDLDNKKDFNRSFNVLIRKVSLKKDSVLFYGNHYSTAIVIDSVYASVSLSQNNSDIKELEYKDNSLSFEFSCLFYEESGKTTYSYILEGFDDTWSIPSHEGKAVYTNIPFGEYIFKVKAFNVYDTESEIAEYRFIIHPPLWKTNLAFLTYVLLFVLLVVGIVRLNSRRLKARNKELERIVEERTMEISQKNKDILAQKEELEEKNVQINHSISYARTIQRAMIPSKEIIDSFFDSFILYKPRDIVSGDFYWASPVEQNGKQSIIVGVVDCTGHGVPGAFMSMIAMSQLNNIVGINKIYSPSKIIDNLNSGIKKALHQEETENNDGMDLGIIYAEDHNGTVKVVFAGAKFPILIYRKSQNIIEKIKGSSSSVGGSHSITGKAEFVDNSFFIEKGDIMYLFSDGFRDQNNAERRRFGSKKFSDLIQKIANLDLEAQKKALNDELTTWQGNEAQRDDVIVVGLKHS